MLDQASEHNLLL